MLRKFFYSIFSILIIGSAVMAVPAEAAHRHHHRHHHNPFRHGINPLAPLLIAPVIPYALDRDRVYCERHAARLDRLREERANLIDRERLRYYGDSYRLDRRIAYVERLIDDTRRDMRRAGC